MDDFNGNVQIAPESQVPVDTSQLVPTGVPTVQQQNDPRLVNSSAPGQFLGGLGNLANEDLSNQDIVDPMAVLKDPNAHPEQKLAVLNQAEKAGAELESQRNEQVKQQVAQKQLDFNNYNNKVLEVTQANERLKKLGMPELPLPTPGSYKLTPADMATFSKPEVQKETQPAAEALNQQQQKTQEQLDFEKQALEQQKKLQAAQLASDREMAQSKARMDKVFADLDEQDKTLDKIEPNRFWNNADTMSKIIGAIALGMGGADLANNPAHQIITNAIDKDIASQKFNIEQKQLLKNNALKRAEAEVQRFSAMSKNNLEKRQLDMLAAQLNQTRLQGIQDAAQQKQLAYALSSGDGLSHEEVALTIPANDPRRNLLVKLPNGRFKMAGNENQAKKYGEVSSEMTEAMSMADVLKNQIKSFSEQSAGQRMLPGAIAGIPLNQKKREIEQTAVGLIGKLRIPFTGPGILSPDEFKRLETKVVGQLSSLQPQGMLQQTESLQRLLQSMQNSQLAAAGIVQRKSPKDIAKENYFKKLVNDGWSPTEIETVFKKNGMMD